MGISHLWKLWDKAEWMSLPVCANSLSLSHLLFSKLMPEHKNHDVKCNQKASLNSVASPSHYKHKHIKSTNVTNVNFKIQQKGKKYYFHFVSLFKFWLWWQKQHLLSKRNLKEKNRIRRELLNCMNACPILLHYSLSRVNDQTWWQSQSEEETEPTKGKVTGPSTTDVSTEGSLLSTEQSHTWETPKSSGNSPENVCSLVKTLSPPYGLPTTEYSRLVQKHRGVLTHKKQSTIAKVCTKGKKETV